MSEKKNKEMTSVFKKKEGKSSVNLINTVTTIYEPDNYFRSWSRQ